MNNLARRIDLLEKSGGTGKKMFIAFGPQEEAQLKREHPNDIVIGFAEEKRAEVEEAFDRAKRLPD